MNHDHDLRFAETDALLAHLDELERSSEEDARALEAYRVKLVQDRPLRARMAAAAETLRVPSDVALVPATALAHAAGDGVHAWHLTTGELRLLSFVNLDEHARTPVQARGVKSGVTSRLTEIHANSRAVPSDDGRVTLPELHDDARFFCFTPPVPPDDTLSVRMASPSGDTVEVLWRSPGAQQDAAGSHEDDDPAQALQAHLEALVDAYQAARRYRATAREGARPRPSASGIERIPAKVTKPVRDALEALIARFKRVPPWARLIVNWYACELALSFRPATFTGFGLTTLAACPDHALPGLRETVSARVAASRKRR
jgi:hypothetical protein